MSILNSPYLALFRRRPKRSKLSHDYLLEFINGTVIDENRLNHTKTAKQSTPWHKYGNGFRGNSKLSATELASSLSQDLNVPVENIKVVPTFTGMLFMHT